MKNEVKNMFLIRLFNSHVSVNLLDLLKLIN
jgi:hypothetical protein